MGKVVLASGVFDLLHYGHLRFLEEAKKSGGEGAKLVVVVARDKTVVRMKGEPPIMPEEERRALVEALKVVDEAILGFEDFDMERVLNTVRPDIVALGYDQGYLEDKVKRAAKNIGINVRIVRIKKFGKRLSSSEIKKQIAKRFLKSVERS